MTAPTLAFVKLPKSSLEGLRASAAAGTHRDFLKANGRIVAEYRWSEYVFATVLPFLREHKIDLMTKTEHDEVASFLTKTTRKTHYILTLSHRTNFLDRLEAGYSRDELARYFAELNREKIGRAMQDGVNALRDSLQQLDRNSVIIFTI